MGWTYKKGCSKVVDVDKLLFPGAPVCSSRFHGTGKAQVDAKACNQGDGDLDPEQRPLCLVSNYPGSLAQKWSRLTHPMTGINPP